jgi:hypothetical protein
MVTLSKFPVKDDANKPVKARSYAPTSPLTRFLFTCSDQSGRTSASIISHRVQTIRAHKERTGISSGSQSPLRGALWWQRLEMQ